MNRSLQLCFSLGVILAGLFSTVKMAAPREPVLQINVRIHNYADVESEMLIRAEQETVRIYRKIGVEAVWLHQALPIENKDWARQQRPDMALYILSHAVAECMREQCSALGVASGPVHRREWAYVFYDRVEVVSRNQIVALVEGRVRRWATTAQILGYTMAHELGHLLGLSHSPTGIMRQGWRSNDLVDAAYGDLGFSPSEAATIQTEVQLRQH